MAYGNMFPNGYQQQYYPQMFQQAPQPQSQPQNGIIWVQGEAGAKSYLVGPNQTAQLWDSESQTIYLKSADASGMPSMKILDYTIRDNNSSQNAPVSAQNAPNLDDYVTREELTVLEERLSKKVEKLSLKGNKKNNEVNADE